MAQDSGIYTTKDGLGAMRFIVTFELALEDGTRVSVVREHTLYLTGYDADAAYIVGNYLDQANELVDAVAAMRANIEYAATQ
jgi:hypothetical protein